MDERANIKKYFDMAFDGEPVIVSRKENKNSMVYRFPEPCGFLDDENRCRIYQIPDEVINRRISFCDKVEIKCLRHIGMNSTDDWNINLWLKSL